MADTSRRWSKERTLWQIHFALPIGRFLRWAGPLFFLLFVSYAHWRGFYNVFKSGHRATEILDWWGIMGFYLQASWQMYMNAVILAFISLRCDLIFLWNYRLRKRRFSQDPEAVAEINRVYNELRRMSLIWLPPRKLPD